jgi:hypothetical protein
MEFVSDERLRGSFDISGAIASEFHSFMVQPHEV